MANEDKATRYQRLRRRATLAAVLSAGFVLSLAHLAGPPGWAVAAATAGPLSQLGSLALGALGLLAAASLARVPAEFYREVVLTRRYGLMRGRPADWLRDWARHAGVGLVLGTLAVAAVAALRWALPGWWWAAGGLLAGGAPVLIGHALQRAGKADAGTPLTRGDLRERLGRVLARAGYPDLAVYQTHVGAQTRLANAAVVTVGGRRRVEITDTLLADHTDEEVEVVLAHELAHVAHHDVVLTQAVTALQGAAVLFLVDAALAATGAAPGVLASYRLPLAYLVAGAAYLLLRPLGLAVSRLQERRADRYSLSLTANPSALASVVRRMAANNLAEPSPTAWTVWWWHSHPGADERMAEAVRRGAAPAESTS